MSQTVSRALIIEDDPLFQKLLKTTLEHSHRTQWRVEVTESVTGARAALAREAFDAILLDMSLPDGRGADLVTAIREAAPDTGIIVLSGHDDATLAQECVARGAQAYVVKGGLGPDALEDVIAKSRSATHGPTRETREAATTGSDARGRFALFVANFTHDLSAPARAIDALSAKLVHSGSADDDARIETARLLREQVAWMNRLLDDASAYAVSLKGTSERDTIDARAVVDAIVARESAGTSAVIEVGELPQVSGARSALALVFTHLVSNAITHHDGDAPRVTISSTGPRAGFATFTVSDDGPGILERDHARAFEPFETMSPKDGRGGSGLGLALVRAIVTDSGGVVTLESKGRGTRVSFTWPADAS